MSLMAAGAMVFRSRPPEKPFENVELGNWPALQPVPKPESAIVCVYSMSTDAVIAELKRDLVVVRIGTQPGWLHKLGTSIILKNITVEDAEAARKKIVSKRMSKEKFFWGNMALVGLEDISKSAA